MTESGSSIGFEYASKVPDQHSQSPAPEKQPPLSEVAPLGTDQVSGSVKPMAATVGRVVPFTSPQGEVPAPVESPVAEQITRLEGKIDELARLVKAQETTITALIQELRSRQSGNNDHEAATVDLAELNDASQITPFPEVDNHAPNVDLSPAGSTQPQPEITPAPPDLNEGFTPFPDAAERQARIARLQAMVDQLNGDDFAQLPQAFRMGLSASNKNVAHYAQRISLDFETAHPAPDQSDAEARLQHQLDQQAEVDRQLAELERQLALRSPEEQQFNREIDAFDKLYAVVPDKYKIDTGVFSAFQEQLVDHYGGDVARLFRTRVDQYVGTGMSKADARLKVAQEMQKLMLEARKRRN